jgi:prepilin-type N-terminal cleavage/methylation domain-containing protein
MSWRNHDFHASRTPRAAFTLIEILSVVIILGIASAVIIPQIGSRGDLEAASAARVIMSDMLYAQNLAISTQGNPTQQTSNPIPYVIVSFDTINQQYGVYYYNSTAHQLTLLTHPVNHDNYQMTFGSSGVNSIASVTLTSASFAGQPAIAFDSTGVPYSFNSGSATAASLTGSGTVVVGSGNYSSTVTVEQDTGDMSVQ